MLRTLKITHSTFYLLHIKTSKVSSTQCPKLPHIHGWIGTARGWNGTVPNLPNKNVPIHPWRTFLTISCPSYNERNSSKYKQFNLAKFTNCTVKSNDTYQSRISCVATAQN